MLGEVGKLSAEECPKDIAERLHHRGIEERWLERGGVRRGRKMQRGPASRPMISRAETGETAKVPASPAPA